MQQLANIYRIHHEPPFPGLLNTRLPAAMHCVEDTAGLVVIDPFLVSAEETAAMEALGRPAYVLITNQNHDRDARQYRRRYGARIIAHRDLAGYFDFALDSAFDDGDTLPGGLIAQCMPGTFKGETIFIHPAQGGSLIVGDAIMNLELSRYGVAGITMRTLGGPEGVGTMPRLLMEDEVQAVTAYRKLVCGRFERILMTHGTPILSQARGQLLQAINNHQSILPFPMRRVISRFFKTMFERL